MKTDAEILALIREELKQPAQLDGLPVTFGSFSRADAVAIYRRAFRDGAEAAAVVCEKVVEEHGGVAAGPMATERGKQIYEAMAAGAKNCEVDIRRELIRD